MRVEEPSLEEQVLKKHKDTVRPQPVNKLIVLAALIVVSMGFFWFTIYRIFQSNLDFSFNAEIIFSFIFAIIALSMMFAIIGMSEVLVDRNLIFIAVIVIGSLTHFIFFPISIPNTIAVLATIFAFIIWKHNIRSDMKSRIKFLVGRVMIVGLNGIISLVLISISFTYYGYLADDGSNKMLDNAVSSLVETVNDVLPGYMPFYSPDMTLDEFIVESGSIDELPSLPSDFLIGEALQEVVTGAQGELLDESRQSFLDTFDIEAKGSDTMQVVTQRIVTSRVDNVIEPYQQFIPVILALSLFFILKLFQFVFRPIIQFFSYLVYKIFLFFRFITVKKVIVEKEQLQLSE